MSPASSTTDARWALEGFLPLWLIGILGLALVALAIWSARQDARVADRPRWVRWFVIPRFVAILILLWMLAGPTWITITRTWQRQAVALLVDRSASMGLVDAADGSGNVARWTATQDNTPASRGLRNRDAAVAEFHAGLTLLQRFSRLPQPMANPADLAEARDLLDRAATGLRNGIAAWSPSEGAAANPPPQAAPTEGQPDEVSSEIEQVLEQTIAPRNAEFHKGKTLVALDRDTWLPAALSRLGAAIRLAEQIADQEARSLDGQTTGIATGKRAAENPRSRHEQVLDFLAAANDDWLGDLRRKVVLQEFEFGETVGPLDQDANRDTDHRPLAPSTHLGAALQQIALANSAQPLAAAIVFTDGGQNGGRDPKEIAPSLAGTALHLVPIGNTRLQRDVILHHAHAPRAVLQKDQVVIDAMVTSYDCANESLRVELLEGDRVVDRQDIAVPTETFDAPVRLQWKAAELGRHTLTLRVPSIHDERSPDNNQANVEVRVMEDRMRVLVADNGPRWETRYLLNLFKRDDRIDFEHLMFEPQPATGPGTLRAFPGSLAEWSRYRVVILGDLLPSQLTPTVQHDLREYLEEGGGTVVLIAGRDAMPAAYLGQPLGDVLPVEAGTTQLPGDLPFHLQLTDQGRFALATQIAETPDESDRIWREASERLPLYSLSPFSQPKPTAHSLVWAIPRRSSPGAESGTPRSFLTWHYVGAGRIVYLAAPATYQLRYRYGDTYHHRFWGQLLRWAIARDLGEGSSSVRLVTEKSRYEEGETVEVSARLRQLDGRPVPGADLELTALLGQQSIQQVPLREDPEHPGVYRGSLAQLPVGQITLRLSGERVNALLAAEKYPRPVETVLEIDPSGDLELKHPLCRLPLLREIADASGGMVVPPTGLAAALSQLSLEPRALEDVSRMPLWNRWDLFWIFIGCLGLEWAARKYVGLS